MSEQQQIEITFSDIKQQQLFDTELSVASLKKALLGPGAESVISSNLGRVPHPIHMANAIALMMAVSLQQTCIQTKRDATVGLGFETEADRKKKEKQKEVDDFNHEVAVGRMKTPNALPAKQKKAPVGKVEEETEDSEGSEESRVEKILDPLCENGFQSLMNQVGEDYENTGNGYIEVVRIDGTITGLWHMPAPAVHVIVEQKKPHTHYEVDTSTASPVKLARFNDAEAMRTRLGVAEVPNELIHFPMPSSCSRYYGMPSWLSCVPWLELAQQLMQYNFDYLQNRAVPDLLAVLTGPVQDKDRKNLKTAIKETIGPGKRHRTIVAAFPSPDVKVQIERLNSDNREKFADFWSTLQLQIVSAHRVPPLLAGVTLPGKMAAANELPNALIAFQTLYIDQQQKLFRKKLIETLGSPEAGLGLTAEDFTFRKITDYYDMGQVDTMSRMRETATEAQFRGRDLEDGLKD